jgi:anti-sigma regulatory factor (Ser/Thr protein kinase)
MIKRALELDPELAPHLSDLYLVLSELLENAICHGLLGLRSEHRPKSFELYLEERRRGLEELRSGRLMVDIERTSSSDVILRIEDSGPGFNAAAHTSGLEGNATPSGRGISLVRAVCADVRFHGRGNMVEAVYRPQLSRTRDDGKIAER